MGSLTYDSKLTVEFDDRVLLHLQAVISSKLRRNESFFFSWKSINDVGDGRTSIWLNATIPLAFAYETSQPTMINRDWVEALAVSANSPAGLRIIDEPMPALDDIAAHRTPIRGRPRTPVGVA